MPLKVICLASYLTRSHDDGIEWRQDDYHAAKFIKAIKGESVKGFAYIPVCGHSYKLEEDNRNHVFSWFGRMAAARLRRTHPELVAGGFAICPVPSSQATVGAPGPFVPCVLARNLAHAIGDDAVVDDILRWNQPMYPARSGGSRDPGELYQHLRHTEGIYEDMPYVLVDDVCTKGGHLQACAAKLRRMGANVALALCAGRTVLDQDCEPFQVPDDVLPDFIP